MERIKISCKYQKDVCISDKTWIHRGGKANYWLQPETIEELVAVGRELYKNKEPFVTIGHTSNTYFRNSFNIKYIIDTRHLKSFYKQDQNTLVCECGVPMMKVAKYCVENGIAGYEGMVGLPGTVGGGIFCNSGCYGCGIDKTLKCIELLTDKGTVVKLPSEHLGFSFRSSTMKRGELKGIILRAYFDMSKHEDKALLVSIAEANNADRKKTQDPPAQNLGSTVNYCGYQKSYRNTILSFLDRVYAHVTRDSQKRYLFRKHMICLLYKQRQLAKYISDKRMNCFIWKDQGADDVYPSYLDMMNKVYKDCTVEIITK